jgi:SpoVK/Ycf46/Vps4 family AAA+-type ATPase
MLAHTFRRGVGDDSAAFPTRSMLDKRLLRPGRFDCVVHVGNPTEEARVSILKRSIKRLPIKTCSCVGCGPSCDHRSQSAVDEFADGLAARTGGMSGAELVHVCRLAAMNAMRRDCKATQIETCDFEEVLISWRRGDYDEAGGNV